MFAMWTISSRKNYILQFLLLFSLSLICYYIFDVEWPIVGKKNIIIQIAIISLAFSLLRYSTLKLYKSKKSSIEVISWQIIILLLILSITLFFINSMVFISSGYPSWSTYYFIEILMHNSYLFLLILLYSIFLPQNIEMANHKKYEMIKLALFTVLLYAMPFFVNLFGINISNKTSFPYPFHEQRLFIFFEFCYPILLSIIIFSATRIFHDKKSKYFICLFMVFIGLSINLNIFRRMRYDYIFFAPTLFVIIALFINPLLEPKGERGDRDGDRGGPWGRS